MPFRLLSYAILTKTSLYFWCVYYDVKFPEIVVKQASLESMHLKCQNCALSEMNNIWGFATSEGYKYFDHWTESVIFYSEFQKKYYKGGDYYLFIEKSWGAPNIGEYIEKLKCIE